MLPPLTPEGVYKANGLWRSPGQHGSCQRTKEVGEKAEWRHGSFVGMAWFPVDIGRSADYSGHPLPILQREESTSQWK